jgi:hypothetical protein
MFLTFGNKHITSQYPYKRVMILHDHREIVSNSDSNDEEMLSFKDVSDDNVKYVVEGKSLMIRRALKVQIKEDDLEQQMRNIFHKRCHINNKICCMIIDGRSCDNVVSTTLVRKLNLNNTKHYRPYKLQ